MPESKAIKYYSSQASNVMSLPKRENISNITLLRYASNLIINKPIFPSSLLVKSYIPNDREIMAMHKYSK